jgi:hypothetical protein
MNIVTHTAMMMIDIKILRHVLTREDLDKTIPPGSQITEGDIKKGILEFFDGVEGFSEDLLPNFIEEYHKYREVESTLESLSARMFS